MPPSRSPTPRCRGWSSPPSRGSRSSSAQARAWDTVLCVNRRQVAFGAPAAVLTPEVLEATYGDELVVLGGGRRAIAVEHHEH